MAKPNKNRVVSIVDAPVLAALSTRILSRMMKGKSNPFDQRRLLITLDRLAVAMGREEAAHVSSCD